MLLKVWVISYVTEFISVLIKSLPHKQICWVWPYVTAEVTLIVGSHTNARPNHWIAPPQRTVKINVNVALLRYASLPAVAAVCRDRSGNYIGSSAITLVGNSDPTTLEAFAVWEALTLADDLYKRRIFVASNCKIVTDDIKQKSAAVYGTIIREMLDHSSFFISCPFSHEFRSLNTKTHNLVKHALSLGWPPCLVR
jgi:hypothetical protein